MNTGVVAGAKAVRWNTDVIDSEFLSRPWLDLPSLSEANGQSGEMWILWRRMKPADAKSSLRFRDPLILDLMTTLARRELLYGKQSSSRRHLNAAWSEVFSNPN